jgi:hypothetical protein
MVALALVLGGTAIAASTSAPLTKKAVTKLVKHLAPSLSVKSAGVATKLASITYVKGPVFDVPASGGSGAPSEGGGSPASLTECPAGTYVIGASVRTQDIGEEINEVIPETPSGAAGPTEVRAYVDNYANTDYPNNWVIAVCAAAKTVNNPSSLAKRRSGR